MKTTLTTLVALTAFVGHTLAASQTFDFKDPKSINNVSFHLDAPLESVNGNANGVSGTITFDPENPAATKGKIIVSSASLVVPNSMQTEHMHGPTWLDVAKNPEITFEAKEVKNVKTTSNDTTADVVGTFTLKGVSKELTIPVKFTYMKDKLAARMPGKTGDLLVVRGSFSIKRSDFNIQPHQMEDKVGDEIVLTLNMAGGSVK